MQSETDIINLTSCNLQAALIIQRSTCTWWSPLICIVFFTLRKVMQTGLHSACVAQCLRPASINFVFSFLLFSQTSFGNQLIQAIHTLSVATYNALYGHQWLPMGLPDNMYILYYVTFSAGNCPHLYLMINSIRYWCYYIFIKIHLITTILDIDNLGFASCHLTCGILIHHKTYL